MSGRRRQTPDVVMKDSGIQTDLEVETEESQSTVTRRSDSIRSRRTDSVETCETVRTVSLTSLRDPVEADFVDEDPAKEEPVPLPVTPVPSRHESRRHSRSGSRDSGSPRADAPPTSMEGLAASSLLAAQLFHLVPTTSARERSFLRSSSALLGAHELDRCLPNRSCTVFVGTWNMNGSAPPAHLEDWLLPATTTHMADVVAVGTQESYPDHTEWEVRVQETLGPSHLLLRSASLGTIHLAVFVRRDLVWFCSAVEEASHSVRPGAHFRTKGAVALAFCLFGTSLLFVTSHLTAHQHKAKERVNDVARIQAALELPRALPCRHRNPDDTTANFDCAFWAGDLNFRLAEERADVVKWVSGSAFPLARAHSLHTDQLGLLMRSGEVFRDFREGPITFAPTYKFDPGTQEFDTSSKQRTPSYTDRVLYRSKARGAVRCLRYESAPSLTTSDHKPVWAAFTLSLRPGGDQIPLAGGMFNREVFLEGLKRRAAAMDKMRDATAVCSVQ